MKYSYKWLEGKHQVALPEAVPDVVAQPVGVGTKEDISSQLSAFEQKILQHLDAEIASQEKVIQQLQANVRRVKALWNDLLAKLLQLGFGKSLELKGGVV